MVTPIHKPHRSTMGMALATIALLAAITYIIMPADFDGPIYGIIDDFCFFMAAFCFAQSQFITPQKVTARALLKRCAVFFACLGILTVTILATIILH